MRCLLTASAFHPSHPDGDVSVGANESEWLLLAASSPWRRPARTHTLQLLLLSALFLFCVVHLVQIQPFNEPEPKNIFLNQNLVIKLN